MEQLKPGDRINCCIKNYIIVNPLQKYDEVLTFEIVAKSEYGYYIYIPPYVILKDSSYFNEKKCKNLGIDRRFYNQNFAHVQDKFIYKIKSIMDGMPCAKCKDFFIMAGPNQENGTFICFGCKSNPYR